MLQVLEEILEELKNVNSSIAQLARDVENLASCVDDKFPQSRLFISAD
jgi:hypothetical protein